MEVEKNQSIYHGSAVKRLLSYIKPHRLTAVLAIILVLMVTALELYKPQLIGRAIDNYIEAYNKVYAQKASGTIKLTDLTLSSDLKDAEHYAEIILYEDNYYLFSDLDRQTAEHFQELAKGEVKAVTLTEGTIELENKKGRLLSSEELRILRDGDIKGIFRVGLLYILATVLILVLSYIQTMSLQRMGQKIIYTIRKELFTHVHNLPLRYFDTHPVGQTVTRVTNDVEALQQMYANILIRLVSNGIRIVGIAAMMFWINVKMTLISFLMVPAVFFLTYFFRKISRKIHREIRTRVSRLNTFLSENISGMRLIQIFANEEFKFGEFKLKSEELYHSNLKKIWINSIFRPLIFAISGVGLAILIMFGINDVLNGTITIGFLYIYISYFNNFFEPIQDLAEQFSILQNALASSEKIFSLLDEEVTIKEKENPQRLTKVEGKVEFKHVWLAYEKEEFVLEDVSFTINPGEKVAFVGATGAGKTSILNLIGRYYEINRGQILIDGIDIKDLAIADIRKAIGQVQQDVFIFNGDIRSNIRLLDQSIDDAKIEASARFVNAAGFIEKLPHQYAEAVSERGQTLSSGQRQLLSFARTLAYDPKILVLDEATANIDTETELLITDALEKLMQGRTTIMVAHRLSTIQHADKIIVMHKGRIRESGTHQELLKKGGMYKKLYDLQLYKV